MRYLSVAVVLIVLCLSSAWAANFPRSSKAHQMYVHPSGDFSMEVPEDWDISPGTPPDFDQILAGSGRLALYCKRDFCDLGVDTQNAALGEFATDVALDLPESYTFWTTVGKAPATVVSTYKEETNINVWHVCFVHKRRMYYIAVFAHMPEWVDYLPSRARAVLDTVRFIR